MKKPSVRFHEKRARQRRRLETMTAKLATLTPDTHPTYREVPDPLWAKLLGIKLRRWSIFGKVYPVKRPKLGKIIPLN